MTNDNTHFENQRAEEQQAALEKAVDARFGGAADDAPQYEEGREPGHLGNDISKMRLLDTDLESLAKSDDHEPNEQVQQALRDLQDIPVREAIAESDAADRKDDGASTLDAGTGRSDLDADRDGTVDHRLRDRNDLADRDRRVRPDAADRAAQGAEGERAAQATDDLGVPSRSMPSGVVDPQLHDR